MHKIPLLASKVKAVIFDMDGVVTRTAHFHAESWKRLFEEFLKGYKKAKPYSDPEDYLEYIDGKPRVDGVAAFLKSRDINLPLGTPQDSAETLSVWGLGNKKDYFFHQLVQEKGVEVYPSTIALIRDLKKSGVRVALITSSRNAALILKSAGVEMLFDATLDGEEAAEKKLRGKPAPDYFLEAIKKVCAAPPESVVVEDARSGVEAGKAAHVYCVIGIERFGTPEKLYEAGADWVVKDLEEVEVAREAPLLLTSFKDFEKEIGQRTPAFFFDYDGTLTPIVLRPEMALLSPEMKELLDALSSRFFVALVSGRDLKNLEQMAPLKKSYFVGSHGYEMVGPQGFHFEMEEAQGFLKTLDEAEAWLNLALQNIPGLRIERKKYAIAIHFREVASSQEKEVEVFVRALCKRFPQLRVVGGKKIWEYVPVFSWNKGKALLWLLKQFKMDLKKICPIYVGDDLTDEDAFFVLQNRGVGIVVQNPPQPTTASFYLRNVEDVKNFLEYWKDHE